MFVIPVVYIRCCRSFTIRQWKSEQFRTNICDKVHIKTDISRLSNTCVHVCKQNSEVEEFCNAWNQQKEICIGGWSVKWISANCSTDWSLLFMDVSAAYGCFGFYKALLVFAVTKPGNRTAETLKKPRDRTTSVGSQVRALWRTNCFDLIVLTLTRGHSISPGPLNFKVVFKRCRWPMFSSENRFYQMLSSMKCLVAWMLKVPVCMSLIMWHECCFGLSRDAHHANMCGEKHVHVLLCEIWKCFSRKEIEPWCRKLCRKNSSVVPYIFVCILPRA